jgi:hypothetical protein
MYSVVTKEADEQWVIRLRLVQGKIRRQRGDGFSMVAKEADEQKVIRSSLAEDSAAER